jgi:excisionase family DNA binding protein
MSTLAPVQDRNVMVDARERAQASQVLKVLEDHPERLTLADDKQPELPAELARILATVVEVLANGGSVSIGSLPEELTTTVAAEQLGVSRPTLMKMIKDGQLPAHKVGSHHRVRLVDLRTFRRARLAAQQRAFDDLRELTADSDEN